jgi:flagellar operon protein
MASVDAINAMSIGGQLQASNAQQPKSSLEKEQFLKLLVAQISHQDPMNPQSSDQYMQQLTQFSTVEQLMNLNQRRRQPVRRPDLGQQPVGASVRRQGGDGRRRRGEPQRGQPAETWTTAVGDRRASARSRCPSSTRPATRSTRSRVPVPAGGHGTFTWNGQDMNGQRAPDGNYHVSFKAGSDREAGARGHLRARHGDRRALRSGLPGADGRRQTTAALGHRRSQRRGRRVTTPWPTASACCCPGEARGRSSTRLRTQRRPRRRRRARPARRGGVSFDDIMSGELGGNSVKVSPDAQERMRLRGIPLGQVELDQIARAMDTVARKGGREALLIGRQATFVVDVPSRTVVTAWGPGETKGHVFTSIDSALMLDS